MLKIAHNISNLSDARYFAAAGFDWLIFNFGPGAAEHRHLIYGISEWISGSKVGMHVMNEAELLYHIEHHPEIKGFWLADSLVTSQDLSGYTIFAHDSSSLNQQGFQIISNINYSVINAAKTLLDLTSLEPSTIDLTHLTLAGIALSGTEEERPGFKSYGNMEAWMDILEEIEN